jgi:protein MPE1
MPMPKMPEGGDESEEVRIQKMFQLSTEHWQHEQARMEEAAPIGYMGGPGINKRKLPSVFDKPPPANYICYRCGQKGHYIQNCPTNGDPTYDKPKIRRTTGIPRSFLRAVDVAPEKREGGVMITPDGGLVVATPDSYAYLCPVDVCIDKRGKSIPKSHVPTLVPALRVIHNCLTRI